MADSAKRKYGKGFGRVLADFLNGIEQRAQRMKKSGVRVKRSTFLILLDDITRLRSPMSADSKMAKTINKRRRRVNRKLREYAVHPVVLPTQDGVFVMDFEPEKEGSFSERNAYSAMAGLIREGLLGRIQRCGRCHKWYFAKKKDSKYCTRHCQTTTTEASRKNKRAYMKKYYKLRKSGKVR